MKTYLAVLILFLVAFTGLAAGLIIKGKRLRGGCGAEAKSDGDCQCKSKSNRKL